jgi:hypothetical protein
MTRPPSVVHGCFGKAESMKLSSRWAIVLSSILLVACGGGSGGGGGSLGNDGGGGGQLCSFNGDTCTASNVCCNGTATTVSGGLCSCVSSIGMQCYGADEMLPSGTNCCNTKGGLSATGTVGTQCGAGSFPTTCSTDANCPVGYKCFNGACGGTSMTCAKLHDFGNAGSCCTGLTPSTPPGAAAPVCLLPAGWTCQAKWGCVSQNCVKGSTTATCQ